MYVGSLVSERGSDSDVHIGVVLVVQRCSMTD